MMGIENIGLYWWAVQGSNLWPLPCQGIRPSKTGLFTSITGEFDHFAFTKRHYTLWASVGGERG